MNNQKPSTNALTNFSYIVANYAFVILLFFVLRIAFYFLNDPGNTTCTTCTLDAFLIGFRFDNNITAYMLVLPFILCLLNLGLPALSNFTKHFNRIWISIVSILVLALMATDFPYFDFYQSRLTISVLNWVNDIGAMAEVVLLDIHYLPFFILFFVLVFLFFWLQKRLQKKISSSQKVQQFSAKISKLKSYWKILLILLLLFVYFSSIRGSWPWQKKGIRVKDAYFTEESFFNQLCINPVFTFMEGMVEKKIDYYSDDVALKEAKKILFRKGIASYPLADYVVGEKDSIRPNIMIVLMESMSCDQMGMFGNKQNLTPYLDSIAKHSLSFNEFYSAGIHTSNGIVASLYGIPAVMNKRIMQSTGANIGFSGLPVILQKKGYETFFVHASEGSFDNMLSFLSQNGYSTVYDRDDYPNIKQLGPWGIPDHEMLNFALPKINKIHAKGKPFMATVLSIATHSPYQIPDDIPFKPSAPDRMNKSYQYADWSIKQFMEQAKKQKWFDNTIFVFIADHGQNFNPRYEMPLAYNHIPCIIYSPRYVQAQSVDKIGMQIDLTPTLMGLTKMSYINNTMGLDLMKHERPYAYFSSDYKWASINQQYYMVVREDESIVLYDRKTKSLKNIADSHPSVINNMLAYAYAQQQATQWMTEKLKTSYPK